MSDVEDETLMNHDEAGDEHEEEEEEVPRKHSRREEEDDEEEEEEDDEEDDEDEDEGQERGKKRAKHRHKRPAVNRFLDVEAEVDEDEDEEEDEDEYARDEFIADTGVEGEDDYDMVRRAADHARYDRRVREMDDRDLEQVAEDISQRYRRTAVRYTGEMSDVPQRLLMPSVHDANLWQVRVRPGKERDIVFSLMRKAIDLEYGTRPLQILSAFQRDSLQGMIYVEARSAKQVSEAINGLVGVFPSRGINLVPIEEMASLLQIRQQELTVTPGTWLRIKRGKYQGDLAQVMDITENGEEVGLKFIPRIDLNPKDEAAIDGRKRKKAGAGLSSFNMRPPQRFFNYEEVVKVYGRKSVAKRNQVYVFQNDTYKDGFIEKDFRLAALQLDDVNPTLDEITRFTRGQDGTENEANVDLSIIAEASRKAAISVLQPGDHVEVFEGEQSGVHGTVHSIEGDVVTIEPVGVDFDGQRIQIPARSVRKRFKPGDHVKVMTGKNADETGLVVSVIDNVVTFLSDMTMQEVSVFSKDLREAAEVGTGTNIVGNYELHDLVQIDQQTVGVIFKTERDSLRVLDQNGQVRLVQPHQITMRRDSNRAIATDSEGHELRIGDNVKEVDGEGRKGRVLHTHQSFFAFLHNREYAENGGVFVTRARSLASLAPKGNILKLGNTDLSKMNPALSGGAGGMVGSGNIGRGPRDRLIGVTITVIKGPNKGYVGTIKDTNGPHARVELLTGNKVITIDKEKLRRRNPDGSLEPLERSFAAMGPPRSGGFGGGQPPSSYNQGGKTPGWGQTGRTPNPYAESRTPAWMVSSRTPNPYVDNGKTPAWDATARTPNPYTQGNKTPAWNTSSRTPNPYNSGGGSSTWAAGSATPGRPTYEAQTPFAPFTPGAVSAPTPAPYSMQTPFEYQTPAGGAYPQTPGLMATGYGANPEPQFELVPKWLLEDEFATKRGIAVEVRGTFGGGWHGGDFEGKQGVVLSVFNTHNDAFESTARVRFFNPVDPLVPILQVPVQYLWPVHPEQAGEAVVILTGSMKGMEAHVEAVESSTSMVITTTETFHVVDTSPGELMRKFDVDEVGNRR
ncbi:transcription elongation factor Spt5 [Trametes maxima]|nr:transcription elongation factor Spt5 [Trametes maxima]